jgi:CubicO group peptidase (beta-lactamase class C family)
VTATTGADRFDALSRWARERAEQLGVPGGAIGIADAGSEHLSVFGVTAVDEPTPITPTTVFRLASMTKVFTATLVMRLVHDGLVELDRPIRAWIGSPRLASSEVADNLTLRHLMAHTGGWLDDPLMEIPDPRTDPDALARLPQLTPLGSTWSYSTTGYFLAGLVVEAVSGMPFSEAMASFLTRPLGLTRTGFDTEAAATYRVAVGHHRAGRNVEPVRPWPPRRWDEAAQGLYSTPADLLALARFHLSDGHGPGGRTLLTAAELREMRSKQVADGSRGLGWVLQDVGGVRLFGHPGGLYGYASDLLLSYAEGFALLVITNVGSHALDREVLPRALEDYFGKTSTPVEPEPRSRSELAAYAGRYVSVSRDLVVSPTEDGFLAVQVIRRRDTGADGVIRVNRPAAIKVGLYGEDRVVELDGTGRGDARGQFLRDEDGRVVLLRFPTFLHVRHPSAIALPDWLAEPADSEPR